MQEEYKPIIKDDKGISLSATIWIVPIVALIISATLIYKYYTQLGSEIMIKFDNSYGLLPKESVIKFRNVTVGTVTRINIQEDGDGVVVYARMSKEVTPYLNKYTKFWIVKPQVDYSGVKGIDTILHGTYINMIAEKKGGERLREFVGSNKPVLSEKEGKIFHLYTDNLGTILVGAPVYYRNLQAGSVKKVTISDDKTKLDISVFIKKDFLSLINVTTKFWQQKLMTFKIENDQAYLEVAPLVNLLFGSIGFESRFDKDYPKVSPKDHFRLYDTYDDTIKVAINDFESDSKKFRFEFVGNVSGIRQGAKIGYSGFDAGRVEKVNITYDPNEKTMKAEVYGTINCSLFSSKEHNGTYNLQNAVRDGLRAVLKSDKPFVGKPYISLEYTKGDTNQSITFVISQNTITDFPTKRKVGNETLSKLESLLDSFAEIASESKKPLKELLVKLNKSADSLNELMGKDSFKSLTDDLNKTMGSINSFTDSGGELDKAIKELRKTLKATKSLMNGYSRSSLFGKKLEAMLKEIGKSSEETKRLIEKLNKKPNSLIFGD